jgi:hypothetical protein
MNLMFRPSNILIALSSLLCGWTVMAQQSPTAQDLESTRATLARWVETQEIISRERQDWQIAREVLEQRIALIEGEIASLEEKIGGIREGIGEADTKQQSFVAENRSLKQASTMLIDVIGTLEAKTNQLLTSLPDPLRMRVSPLSERLPADPTGTDLTLSERFQNVIGILNEINKFNQEISVTSEVRPLPDGPTAEVKVLYLGLGQAYYVTVSGNAAGIGHPSPEGWSWTAANELADEVTRAIAILQNERVPSFVPLPVTIQ